MKQTWHDLLFAHWPISFEELVETSGVALHVEDALFGRVSDRGDSV